MKHGFYIPCLYVHGTVWFVNLKEKNNPFKHVIKYLIPGQIHLLFSTKLAIFKQTVGSENHRKVLYRFIKGLKMPQDHHSFLN